MGGLKVSIAFKMGLLVFNNLAPTAKKSPLIQHKANEKLKDIILSFKVGALNVHYI